MVIGYQLIQSDNKTISATNRQVIEAAKLGLIDNATYSKSSNTIKGSDGTDLRKLDTIQINSASIEKEKYTYRYKQSIKQNHELAKQYIEKSKLIGIEIELNFLNADRVGLVRVRDTTGNLKVFTIPRFITDIVKLEHLDNERSTQIF